MRFLRAATIFTSVVALACGDDSDAGEASESGMMGEEKSAESAAARKSCVADSAAGYERYEQQVDMGLSSVANSRVADLNGDGKADLLLTMGRSEMVVLLGQERGFASPGRHDFGACGIGCRRTGVVKDVNGDKFLDLVWAEASVFIALGDGTGKLTLKAKQPLPYDFETVDVLDADSDGTAELIAYTTDSETCKSQRKQVEAAARACTSASDCGMGEGCDNAVCKLERCHHVITYTVDATGQLSEKQKSNLLDHDSPSGNQSIQGFGDVDADGQLDALVAGLTSTVYLNSGNLTFAPARASGVRSQFGLLEDMDGDGLLDLLGGGVIVWGNAWSATMQERVSISNAYSDDGTYVDVDGDKDKDIVTQLVLQGTQPAIQLDILQSRKLAEQRVICTQEQGRFVQAGDFNGDGKVDLVSSSAQRQGLLVLYQR